jgi:hypothetical protein
VPGQGQKRFPGDGDGLADVIRPGVRTADGTKGKLCLKLDLWQQAQESGLEHLDRWSEGSVHRGCDHGDGLLHGDRPQARDGPVSNRTALEAGRVPKSNANPVISPSTGDHRTGSRGAGG